MGYSPARAIDVGSVIAGTYTIEGLIGKGGMGEVYLASHARLPGKKVAIKILHPDIADAEALARFRREAEIASRLGHPNIVEVHDWNQLEDGTPYLVLELLQGEALSDRLRHGPIPLDDVYVIVRQVGSALAAAHREGIIHRDLKPQNIFVAPNDDGSSLKAKVLDFGISKIRGSNTVKTQESSLLGTPQYMAPEQATGQHSSIDGRTDVFALGAVVFEMIAGTPAFRGETIPEVVFKVVYEPAPALDTIMPDTPPHVVAAVARALAKKPDERWPDIAAFVEALTRSPLTTTRRAVGPGGGVGGPITGRSTSGAGAMPTGMEATGRSATGAGKASQDAYAATVGSGDHGAALADSVRQALIAGPAPTVTPVARRSRKGLWLGLGAVAVAGGAMAIAMAVSGGKGGGGAGSGGSGAGTGQVAIGTGAIDAGTAGVTPPGPAIDAATAGVPGVTPGVAIDAALTVPVAVDAGVTAPPLAIDAGARVVRAIDAGPRVVRAIDAGAAPPPGDEPSGNADLDAAVKGAKAALASGDADEAIAIARAAIVRHKGRDLTPLRLVKAKAECVNGDRGAATATLQKVDRPRLVKMILANCGGGD